jgi:hypothetical protein
MRVIYPLSPKEHVARPGGAYPTATWVSSVCKLTTPSAPEAVRLQGASQLEKVRTDQLGAYLLHSPMNRLEGQPQVVRRRWSPNSREWLPPVRPGHRP